MGVDTHVIIPDVKEDDLIYMLSKISNSMTTHLKDGSSFAEREGYLNFSFFDEDRSMFCILKKKKYEFDYEGKHHVSLYYEDYPFLKGKVKTNYWWLDLGYNDTSVLILSFISYIFNGWIDENDCDSNDWQRPDIDKRGKELIRRIFESEKKES